MEVVGYVAPKVGELVPLRARVAAAIREAVLEERKACVARVEAERDPGPLQDELRVRLEALPPEAQARLACRSTKRAIALALRGRPSP